MTHKKGLSNGKKEKMFAGEKDFPDWKLVSAEKEWRVN